MLVSASTILSLNHSRPCGHFGMSERLARRSSSPTYQIAGRSCDDSSTCGLSSARARTRLLVPTQMYPVRCASKVRQCDWIVSHEASHGQSGMDRSVGGRGRGRVARRRLFKQNQEIPNLWRYGKARNFTSRGEVLLLMVVVQ